MHFYGSWMGADNSRGTAESAWYRAVPDFEFYVAGYPNRPGNELFIEARTREGAISRVSLRFANNPSEAWFRRRVRLNTLDGTTAFRIVAKDGAGAPGGWLGFSDPFLVRSADETLLIQQFLLCLLTGVSALTLFLGPGLILRAALCRRGRQISFVWVPVPGSLGLAVCGFMNWVAPPGISPEMFARSVVLILALSIAAACLKYKIFSPLTKTERKALAVVCLLTLLCTAKAIYSLGPEGELYGGTVSRTLEVGGRSDSRLSYFVAQLVGLRLRPFSDFANLAFSPYNFTDRGPLAGLATSSIVLAGPTHLEPELPMNVGTVFDAQGFAAYRISMIALAACSLLTAFGLARLFLSESWSFLAFLVASTSPFVIHEIFFTWPKLEDGSFSLLSAYLVFRKRYFCAGLMLGIAYLYHPAALVNLPALLLLSGAVVLESRRATAHLARAIGRWLWRVISVLAGLGLWTVLWRRLGRKHFHQGHFFGYLFEADTQTPTVAHWLRSRFDSTVDTLVPLNVLIFHRKDWALNAIITPSPLVIQYFMQPWMTLPFGAGILFFPFLILLMWIATKRELAFFCAAFVIPFICFDLSYGTSRTGLLREGLHGWFLGLMIFAVYIWSKFAANRAMFSKLCQWALALRGLETVLMLVYPGIWSNGEFVQHRFRWTDSAALTTVVLVAVLLSLMTFRAVEEARAQHSQFVEACT